MTLTERLDTVSLGIEELASEAEKSQADAGSGLTRAWVCVNSQRRILDCRYASDLRKWRRQYIWNAILGPRGMRSIAESYPKTQWNGFPPCFSYGTLSIFMMLFAVSSCGWWMALAHHDPDSFSRMLRRFDDLMEEDRNRRRNDYRDPEESRTVTFAGTPASGPRSPSRPYGGHEEDPDVTRARRMAEYIDDRRTREWYEGNDDPL